MIKLEIDCAPRLLRPYIHFNNIITLVQESDLNNEIKELVVKKWDDMEPISKQFGNWEWELESLTDETKNDQIVKFVFNYLKKSYTNGEIRYGYVDIE